MNEDRARQEPVVITVELAIVAEESVRRERIEVRRGTTLAEALAGFAARGAVRGDEISRLSAAVFGRVRGQGYVLHDGDRIDLLGALLADPKLARRERAERRRAVSPTRKPLGGGGA